MADGIRIARLHLSDCRGCQLLRVGPAYQLGRDGATGSDWSCSGVKDAFPGKYAKPTLFNRGLLAFVEDPNKVLVLRGRPDWCPLPKPEAP